MNPSKIGTDEMQTAIRTDQMSGIVLEIDIRDEDCQAIRGIEVKIKMNPVACP